jgi:hypothetical protein
MDLYSILSSKEHNSMLKKMLNESGVAGADRVKSRQDFQQFITSYKNLISKFPGFQGMNPSGSYNSDMSKNDFGDIDLVVHIASNKDKATVKKELQTFFHAQPETVIVPFSSEKHAGKRSYNAGELVSVRYHDDRLGYSAQIDNIIALDQSEATFKQQFLDWPAEKQGLILGLVKIAAIETEPAVLFKKLGISAPTQLEQNQEYEFNLSSVELQLRLVTYDPELLAQGQYKQTGRETVWTSRNFDDIQTLLYQYNLDAGFDQLLAQSKKVIKNPRSNARMQGVFGSMITVKSGEVGTAKGANKIAALDKIKNTLGETRSIFRALLEAPQPSTVVFAFGRLQPPTIGHELLVNEVKQIAQQHGCPYVIYVSKTVGKTPAEKLKNPLTVEQKMSYLQRMFPGTHFAPATDVINTPIKAAQHLNQKYQNLIMVAGGSRAEDFEKLLNDYNGKDYNFDSIKVVKIDRDPDAEDASGMSGTKMRQAAAADNYELFKSGLPGTIDDATAQQLMADVKAGMTLTPKSPKAPKNSKPVAELDTKKTWADYGMADKEPPKEKVFHGWTEYDLAQKEKEKQQAAKKTDKPVKEKMMPAGMFAGSDKNKLGVAGQWRNKGAKKNKPAKQGDLVGGAEESIIKKGVASGLYTTEIADVWSGNAVVVSDKNGKMLDTLDINTAAKKYGLDPNDIRDQLKIQTFTIIQGSKGPFMISRPMGGVSALDRHPTPNYFPEETSPAMADTAKRLANKDDGKVAKLRAAGDKKREQEYRYAQMGQSDDDDIDENNNMEPGPNSIKRGVGFQNYVSRPQAPMGPMEAVKSAAARLQSALQREKERRQSRERLGQELLNPKKPEPKQVPVSEDVQNIMDALINKIVVNEAIQNNKR